MFGRGRSGVTHPELNDTDRRHAGQVEFGTVHEADYAKARVRVLIGDEDDDNGHLITAWLPMPGARAGKDRDWHPLEVGENVVILSPGGELQNGVVIPAGIYNEDNPAPGDKAGLWRREFEDGGVIEYDRETGEWLVKGLSKCTLAVGDDTTLTVTDGEIVLSAGGVTLTVNSGGVAIEGGSLEHDGKNVGKDHRHKDVQPGAGQSGDPV